MQHFPLEDDLCWVCARLLWQGAVPRLLHGANEQQPPVLWTPSGHGAAAFLRMEQKGFGARGTWISGGTGSAGEQLDSSSFGFLSKVDDSVTVVLLGPGSRVGPWVWGLFWGRASPRLGS